MAKLKTKTSVEDYSAGERNSRFKHEYIYGEVYAGRGAIDKKILK